MLSDDKKQRPLTDEELSEEIKRARDMQSPFGKAKLDQNELDDAIWLEEAQVEILHSIMLFEMRMESLIAQVEMMLKSKSLHEEALQNRDLSDMERDMYKQQLEAIQGELNTLHSELNNNQSYLSNLYEARESILNEIDSLASPYYVEQLTNKDRLLESLAPALQSEETREAAEKTVDLLSNSHEFIRDSYNRHSLSNLDREMRQTREKSRVLGQSIKVPSKDELLAEQEKRVKSDLTEHVHKNVGCNKEVAENLINMVMPKPSRNLDLVFGRLDENTRDCNDAIKKVSNLEKKVRQLADEAGSVNKKIGRPSPAVGLPKLDALGINLTSPKDFVRPKASSLAKTGSEVVFTKAVYKIGLDITVSNPKMKTSANDESGNYAIRNKKGKLIYPSDKDLSASDRALLSDSKQKKTNDALSEMFDRFNTFAVNELSKKLPDGETLSIISGRGRDATKIVLKQGDEIRHLSSQQQAMYAELYENNIQRFADEVFAERKLGVIANMKTSIPPKRAHAKESMPKPEKASKYELSTIEESRLKQMLDEKYSEADKLYTTLVREGIESGLTEPTDNMQTQMDSQSQACQSEAQQEYHEYMTYLSNQEGFEEKAPAYQEFMEKYFQQKSQSYNLRDGMLAEKAKSFSEKHKSAVNKVNGDEKPEVQHESSTQLKL